MPPLQQRLWSLPGAPECDPEQIDLLGAAFARDLAAHQEEAARDLLAPPPTPEKVRRIRREPGPNGRRKAGPIPRGIPEPDDLRAALAGRTARRRGPATGAEELDDHTCASRVAFTARHKARLTDRDLAVQEEWTDRRALTYTALTSDAACLLARTVPDVLVPRIGASSRIRLGIIGVMIAVLRLQKTGAKLGGTEFCKLLFCSPSRLIECRLDLEEEGWLITVARYVPTGDPTRPCRHLTNFYVPGPKLLEAAHLFLEPTKPSEEKKRAARVLRKVRQKHAARLHRGPHRPRPFLSPEAYVEMKAAEDTSELEREEMVHQEQQAARAKITATCATSGARIVAGESPVAILEEVIEARDRLKADEAARPRVLPAQLLAEARAARALARSNSDDRRPSRYAADQGLERNAAARALHRRREQLLTRPASVGVGRPARSVASDRRRPGRQGGSTTRASGATVSDRDNEAGPRATARPQLDLERDAARAPPPTLAQHDLEGSPPIAATTAHAHQEPAGRMAAAAAESSAGASQGGSAVAAAAPIRGPASAQQTRGG